MTATPPRWDLSNVYPGLEAPEFKTDLARLTSQIGGLEALFARSLSQATTQTPIAELAGLAGEAIQRLNEILELASTMGPYIFSFVATDSHNTTARRQLSEFEQIGARLDVIQTQLQAWVGGLAPLLDQIIAADPLAQAHAFTLKEAAEQSRYLMSQAEEVLAAEMNLSGFNAWSRLQGTVTSQLSVDFEMEGQVQKLPLPAIINLQAHQDEDVRRRAYEAEIQACESVREPLAACMNGVKGTVNTLDQRRGRQDALHSAIDTARIDRPTLEAMLDAMQASFPTFRKYFLAKARRLGKEQLAWWDLFAPVGQSKVTYTFEEGRDFILENFASFTPDLAAFAKRAFEHHWIDAEQRQGKRGGAFCMALPGVKESRLLCNFDGTLGQVSTIAHELGHAYHNHCAFQANKTPLQASTPMTLAETASIMCETIVMQAVLRQTSDPQSVLAILETMLINDAQVIVDIYSRYLFEKEVFERRPQAELSADDFCDIMERAQKATYGDGLDARYLNRYMWAWKPHYYRTDISFYNFPYAFGLLFGVGLYAIYQQRGAEFVPDYRNLLASTGEGTAAELAARFGIDIRQSAFWQASLEVIAQRIERYCQI
ncbi:MAG: M3 family oligoendopeptidase [Chloroflexota bacterium]